MNFICQEVGVLWQHGKCATPFPVLFLRPSVLCRWNLCRIYLDVQCNGLRRRRLLPPCHFGLVPTSVWCTYVGIRPIALVSASSFTFQMCQSNFKKSYIEWFMAILMGFEFCTYGTEARMRRRFRISDASEDPICFFHSMCGALSRACLFQYDVSSNGHTQSALYSIVDVM
jgi:hypothetical protein